MDLNKSLESLLPENFEYGRPAFSWVRICSVCSLDRDRVGQFCCFITVTSVESTSTFVVVVRRIYFLHFPPPIMQKAVFHLDLLLAIPFSILHDVLLTRY
jgi:hypothetical protein